MAEYFPLLDRAVSGLPDPTAEARRSIYDRARAALIGQLSRMDPPVPEDDIARESAALDEAIARIEAGFAAPPVTEAAPTIPMAAAEAPTPPAGPATAGVVPGAPHPSEAQRSDAPTPDTRAPDPRPRDAEVAQARRADASPPARPAAPVPGTAPPIVPPPSRERPMPGQRAAPAIDRPTVPLAADAANGAPARVPPRPSIGATSPLVAARSAPAPRGTRPVMALRPVAPVAQRGEETSLPPAGRLPAEPPEASETEADAPRDGFAAALDAAGRAEPGAQDGSAGPKPRDAALRPPAPRPRKTRRFGWPAAAVLMIVLVAMVGVGIAAYRLRDRPEQVVATRTAATAPEASTPGKTVDRASPATPDTAADAPAEPTTGASVPAPVGQGATDAAPAASAGPSIAVAQRAALLVDAPDEPQRVKTYVGTVVWHLDSVSPGQGQPLATAVKADVDIPDAKLKVTMLMQRNPEPQLPASHTIEFHFLPQPGNTLGSVKQVNVPEMRKDDDAPTGDPLAGVPVAITDNYFLVGLSRGAAESQNLRLITERNWFDMSLLFVSGKLGKLTFEKGAAGQRLFEDATKAWK